MKCTSKMKGMHGNILLEVCQPLRKNQTKSFLIIRYATASLKKHEIVSYFALNIVFIFKIFFLQFSF